MSRSDVNRSDSDAGDRVRGLAIPAVVTATLGIAVACWVFSIRQMSGMPTTSANVRGANMGSALGLGSFGFFLALWVSMMAAMMLPGVVPAAVRRARLRESAGAVPAFLASYLLIWTVVGLAVYAVYRPPGTDAAGAVTVAAGLYELTPLKRRCRRFCHDRDGSGFAFGLNCIGSNIGLTLMLVAIDVMSIAWMAIVTILAAAQKVLPVRAAVDVPLAVAVIGLGFLMLVAPASVPGFS